MIFSALLPKLTWILVMYVPALAGATVDSSGTVTMPAPIRVEINMPDYETCAKLAAINTAECWAHEDKPDAETHTTTKDTTTP